MSRVKASITPRGIVLGSAALIMLATGLVLADGELLTVGLCGLIIVLGSYFLARLNLSELELTAQLPPRFFAMRSVHTELELRNRRRCLHARAVQIHLRFVHQVKRHAWAPWTAAGSRSVLRERLSIPGRAAFSEVDYELSSAFPLGLFVTRRSSRASRSAMIYPQPITPPELLWGGLQADQHPNAGASLGDLFGEPRGIRHYQPGDKASRIHQTASARSISRGQGLQVRAFDPPGFHPQSCRVVFHSVVGEGEMIRLDRFERALSLLVGVLVHLRANQGKVTLQADFMQWQSLPVHSRTEHIACLALLTTAQRARQTPAAELVEILQKAPKEEQVIIVSDSPPDQWAELLPPTQRGALLINIRELHFKRPGMQFQARLPTRPTQAAKSA